MLTAWAAEQDAVGSRRDQVVRAAIDAGLSKSEVQRLLEAVAHPAAGVGRVGDALLDPFDDFEVLPVDQVPEAFELV